MAVESVVAVVDGGPNVVVWWVSVMPAQGSGVGRLTGAWVLTPSEVPAKLSLLLGGRTLLVTPAGRDVLSAYGTAVGEIVDVAASEQAVAAEVERLQLAYRKELGRLPGRSLVEPNWPAFALYTAAPADPGAAREVDVTLHIARWLADLAGAWDALEGQRLTRRYLHSPGGTTPRQLPLVLKAAAA